MVAKTLLKVNSNTRIFLEIFQHFQSAYLQERLWMDTSENSYGKLRNPGQESLFYLHLLDGTIDL